MNIHIHLILFFVTLSFVLIFLSLNILRDGVLLRKELSKSQNDYWTIRREYFEVLEQNVCKDQEIEKLKFALDLLKK